MHKVLGGKYPFDVLISVLAREQSAQRVKGVDVLRALTYG